MNLVRNLRWAVIASSILSGSSLAAINCTITPNYSIITEGQALQLSAACDGALTSVDWQMDGTTVTGSVPLIGHTAADPIHYTTPVGLGGSNTFAFTLTGTTSPSASVSSNTATVVVKPSSAVVARAAGIMAPTTPVNAACGTANGTAVSTMPTNGQQCDLSKGKPSLAISGPTSFTWTCTSLTGGLEHNCSAQRVIMYTVTATDSGSPNGSVSPTSQQVAGGNPATVTAVPAATYNTSWSSTCGGTPSGNSYTISAVNANCTVTASFTTAPAAVNGACGSSNGLTLSAAPATNLCSTGTASSVTTGTSTYNWSCAGSNGGSTPSCSAAKTATTPGSDPGSGSWLQSSNRLIADQSGTSSNKTTYSPGCMNGEYPPSSSSSGCAGKTLDESGFAFGSGKVQGIRYMSRATVSNSVKYFQIMSGDGANPGSSTRAWLSTDATATWDSTPSTCRWVPNPGLFAITGTGYCVIQPNKRYYLFISTDVAGMRFQVDERMADLD